MPIRNRRQSPYPFSLCDEQQYHTRTTQQFGQQNWQRTEKQPPR